MLCCAVLCCVVLCCAVLCVVVLSSSMPSSLLVLVGGGGVLRCVDVVFEWRFLLHYLLVWHGINERRGAVLAPSPKPQDV